LLIQFPLLKVAAGLLLTGATAMLSMLIEERKRQVSNKGWYSDPNGKK
jgi:hypothetical protein